MKIEKIWLENFVPTDGLIVVIDVIRAFTTAANAFHHGAKEIFPVLEVEDAFALQKDNPHLLMMGEVQKEKIEGFHFGNSPTQFIGHTLEGASMVQRTTCGTRGVMKALEKANHILASSFVIANATVKRIEKMGPKKITLLMTSKVKGDEDAALADYLEKLLLGISIDPTPYLERTRAQDAPPDQKAAILDLDRFDFAIELFNKDSLPVLKPVYPNGSLWN